MRTLLDTLLPIPALDRKRNNFLFFSPLKPEKTTLLLFPQHTLHNASAGEEGSRLCFHSRIFTRTLRALSLSLQAAAADTAQGTLASQHREWLTSSSDNFPTRKTTEN